MDGVQIEEERVGDAVREGRHAPRDGAAGPLAELPGAVRVATISRVRCGVGRRVVFRGVKEAGCAPELGDEELGKVRVRVLKVDRAEVLVVKLQRDSVPIQQSIISPHH